MKLNVDLFNALATTGTNVNSLADAPLANITTRTNTVTSRIAQVQGMGVDLGDLPSKVGVWTGKINDVRNHTNNQKVNMLDQLGKAAQASKFLGAVSSTSVSECMGVLGGAGFITGGFNHRLDAIGNYLEGLGDALQDYIDGGTLAALVDYIESFVDDMEDGVETLMGNLSDELGWISELDDVLERSRIAQAVAGLWDNPCVRSVLQDITPNEIKTAITNPDANIFDTLKASGFPDMS